MNFYFKDLLIQNKENIDLETRILRKEFLIIFCGEVTFLDQIFIYDQPAPSSLFWCSISSAFRFLFLFLIYSFVRPTIEYPWKADVSPF